MPITVAPVAAALILLAGLVQLIPIVGLCGPDVLERLYGARTEDPTLVLLLRHRAVLLALVGAGLVGAALSSRWLALGLGLALCSKLTYVGLAFTTSGLSAAALRVAWVDVMTAALLVAATALLWRQGLLP